MISNSTSISAQVSEAPQVVDRPPSPTLNASVRDGMAHAGMLGIGENYLGVYGVFLKLSSVQIGLLASLPPFIGALSQLISVWGLRFFKSRRTLLVRGATLQALLWLPIMLVGWLGLSPLWAGTLLIAVVTLYHVAGAFPAPAWSSLVGDAVPSDQRGRFFGLRNRNIGFCTFAAMVAGGFILETSKGAAMTLFGFTLLFSLASLFRAISASYLVRYEDPPHEYVPGEYFSFWDFIKRMPHSNFAKFVFFVSTINFAVAFSAPYFTLYMLDTLGMAYSEFTFVNVAATVTQFLTMQHWGRISDQFGNKKILNVCGWAVGLVPLLWLFGDSTLWLVLVQAFSGFVWAGFNLASANFIFDAVTPAKRARCVAYQAVVNAAFVLAGALLGGIAASNLPSSIKIGLTVWHFGSPLLIVFVISALLRLLAASTLLPFFNEVRSVNPTGHRELLFTVMQVRPIAGFTFGLYTGVRSIALKVREKRNGKQSGRSTPL